MKSHRQIFLLLFSLLLALAPADGYSQTASQKLADKAAAAAKNAETAAKKAEAEAKKDPKDCDKIVKAVEDAAAAAADARKAADAAKAAADLETDAGAKKDAAAAAAKAAASADAAEASAGKALDAAPGMKKAADIGKKLDEIGKKVADDKDLSDTQKKAIQEVLDKLKEGAAAAGKANPCDPKAVEDAFEKLLNDFYEKHGGYGPLKDFFERYFRYNLEKRRIYLQLIRYSPPLEQFVSATGTGLTTGHVATLKVYNPAPVAVMAEIPACFIPSDGRYQPYITLPITVKLLPAETLQVALQGFCGDVFAAPVPKGHNMPPVSEWIRLDEVLSDITVPMVNTSAPTASNFYPKGNPTEVGPVLLEALEQIAQTYDGLVQSGSISTPFSGNPEKERESVIQQTLWMYTSALAGKQYRQEDFRANMIEQYEATSGQSFKKASEEDKERIETGVAQFWSTFQLVGTEAKVLTTH